MAVPGTLAGWNSTLGQIWIDGPQTLEDAIEIYASILAHYTLDDALAYTNLSDIHSGNTLTITNLNVLTPPSRDAIDYPSARAGIHLTDSYARSNTTFNFAVGSVELWFRTLANAANGMLAGFYDSSSKTDKVLWVHNDGSLKFTANDGTAKTLSIANYGLNHWHHAVGVCDGTNCYLYLDGGTLNGNGGQVVSTGCGNTINTYTTNNFYLAGGPPDTWNITEVILDEVVLWNRALTAVEIYNRFLIGAANLQNTATRITQEVIEILRSDSVNARITQEVVEILRDGAATKDRITQLVVEVLRSSLDAGINLSQSVTVAQVIGFNIARSVSLSQNVTVTDRAVVPKFGSVTNTVTVGQTLSSRLAHIYHLSLTQGITTTQAIGIHRAVNVHVADTVTVTEDQTSLLTTLVDRISVTQSIGFNKVIFRAVSDNVNVSDVPFVWSPRVINVTQLVFVSDSNTARNAVTRMSVTDTVFVLDAVAGHNAINRQSVTQSVGVSDRIILRDAINRQTVTDNITVSSRVNTIYTQHIVHDINIVDIPVGVRNVIRTIADTLTPIESYTKTRSAVVTFIDQLEIIETLTKQTTLNRSWSDIETLKEQYFTVLMIGIPLPPLLPPGTPYPDPSPRSIPGIPIAKKNEITISGNGNIVLPAPNLGDEEKAAEKLIVKRSVTGDTYTYITTSKESVLKYTWTLGTLKALELADFIFNNVGQKLSIVNWKGEIWSVICLTDPELITKGRFNKELEANEITLEFQGTKSYG